MVGPSEQDPVAGHQAQVADQDVGHLSHARRQLGVGPGLLIRDQATPTPAPGQMAVEQELDAVELLRVAQLGEGEEQLRPGLQRGEVVSGEGVDVRRRRQLHGHGAPTCE